MVIQKFDDGVLPEIELKTLHLDIDLARGEALLGIYPTELGDNMGRRPLSDPRMPLGIAIARAIDGHLVLLKSNISLSHHL
jgi:hypothetical protein